VASKPKGKKLSDSPAQSPSANPTTQHIARLKGLHEILTANFNAQCELERNAEAILTRIDGGVTLDNPNRTNWEDYLIGNRSHRRWLKEQLDELDYAIWRTEKAATQDAETLQDWYANARRTSAECLGHKKGDRNDRLAAAWLGELERRGLRPDGRDGQFNGDGAS
jgi:hypothetical protein